MADGSLQESKLIINVEVYVGDLSFNLELLVIGRSANHLTAWMDFLPNPDSELILAGYSVKLGNHNITHTMAAANKARSSDGSKIPPTPDQPFINSSKKTHIKTAINYENKQCVDIKHWQRLITT